jgi:signal transduction histidine kinase
VALRMLLPGADSLDPATWRRRHQLLQMVLLAHVPVLLVLALACGSSIRSVLAAGLLPVVAAGVAAHRLRRRPWAAACVSAGLVWCSLTPVAITGGAPEARYLVFVLVGLVAAYRDRLASAVFAGLYAVGQGVGLLVAPAAFSVAGGGSPDWRGAGVLSAAVVLAGGGVALFGRLVADEQIARERLDQDLARADAATERRRFISDLLVNLGRRNQSLLGRQIDIITGLEDAERDPETLGELVKLDHLAVRIRRNAASLLVLAGETPPRVWAEPVAVRDVLRAALTETVQMDRVELVADDQLAMVGNSVADLTHLVAELADNAVRLSPPDSTVTIQVHPDPAGSGDQVLTVVDAGVGMADDRLEAANALLADPGEVDLSSVSARLGLHVVARLARRHDIPVSLSSTQGGGLTATLRLPGKLFVSDVPVRSTGRAPARIGLGGSGAAASAEIAVDSADVRGRHAPPEWHRWWDADGVEPSPVPGAERRDGAPPALDAGSTDTSSDPPAVGRRKLRRRVPLDALAPHLRGPERDRPAVAGAGNAVRTLAHYQASRPTSPTASSSVTTTEDPDAVFAGLVDSDRADEADAGVSVHG